MPIKSYLAYPAPGGREALQHALQQLPECRVIPAANRDVFIVITDTPHEEAEKEFLQKLYSLPALLSLTLISGFADPA